MIRPEQVPDAVVDALLDSSNVAKPWKHAIAAALNAWPGMSQLAENDSASIREMAALILPLPQEASDD